MSERRFAFAALLFYLALSAAVLLPGLPSLSQHALGDEHSDALKHVWGQWWVHRHFTQQHHFPLEMDLANHPDGGRFYNLDSANAIISLALRPLFNPVATYNLLFLLHLALAGLAAFLLARELTGNRWASLVAGAVFAFSPYVLSFPVGSGVAETAFLFPLPLVILFGLRTIGERSLLNPIVCALLLLLQGFATWSYGIYAALFLFFIAVAFLAIKLLARCGHGFGLFADTPLDKHLLLRAGLFLLILLAAALPLYLTVVGTVSGENVMYERPLSIYPGPGPKPTEEPQLTSFAWVDFFLPGEGGRRADMFVDKLVYVAYAGFFALVLGLVGLWRKKKGAWLFAAAAALFFAFALGPVAFAGHAREWPAVTNPIYLLFYYAFPLFNATIHSVDRFAVAFQLALSVVAAFGAAALLDRFDKAKTWLAVLLPLAVLAEYLLVSPAPWPIPVSLAKPHPVSIELAENNQPGAVLDLPAYYGTTGLFVGDIFFQQTIHQRAIPYSLEGVGPTVRRNPFFAFYETSAFEQPPPPVDPCSGVPALVEAGFAFVVLRPDRLDAAQSVALVDMLERCLGEGRPIADAVLYHLP